MSAQRGRLCASSGQVFCTEANELPSPSHDEPNADHTSEASPSSSARSAQRALHGATQAASATTRIGARGDARGVEHGEAEYQERRSSKSCSTGAFAASSTAQAGSIKDAKGAGRPPVCEDLEVSHAAGAAPAARSSTWREFAHGEPADQCDGQVVDGVLGTRSMAPSDGAGASTAFVPRGSSRDVASASGSAGQELLRDMPTWRSCATTAAGL
mmetsp:Transcript_7990/g.22799  ORF Transcript_7990/g.22799 Transcript_7990/m.22799 type:complete len:214 (-) Transcript_7990:212-853(-)